MLTNFALHVTLYKAEQSLIQSALQVKTIKKNKVLLSSGEVCRNIYFINRGCLRIYHTDKHGAEHNNSFCPENWWAVDIASFSHQSPAFYAIAALEDTELFYLSHSALEKLYLEVPKLERFFRILTQNAFNLYQRRITYALSKTAEERYLAFCKQYPGLEQRVAQKQIASYLGITPIFLSRLRKQR
ncbi:CRP-like cAMP-binding protein [Mucilaginibacter lappiensis]|uniref:CRP-like cAMP-binding protein n=2 Tax=Mucilaginibacter lappiensis TaxID=354630 RepID=A0A841JMJ7_9SPHI|nr:CRP-like cAMP-binding protein [Mucilaginibacter lappiensis]